MPIIYPKIIFRPRTRFSPKYPIVTIPRQLVRTHLKKDTPDILYNNIVHKHINKLNSQFYPSRVKITKMPLTHQRGLNMSFLILIRI